MLLQIQYICQDHLEPYTARASLYSCLLGSDVLEHCHCIFVDSELDGFVILHIYIAGGIHIKSFLMIMDQVYISNTTLYYYS